MKFRCHLIVPDAQVKNHRNDWPVQSALQFRTFEAFLQVVPKLLTLDKIHLIIQVATEGDLDNVNWCLKQKLFVFIERKNSHEDSP